MNFAYRSAPKLPISRVSLPSTKSAPTVFKLNFHGGHAPTVGGFGSFISRQARKVTSVASTVADAGSTVVRGAVSTVGRPVANAASAIIHPIAYAVSDVPVIGKIASLAPAVLSVGNKAVGIASTASGISSDISQSLFGKNANGEDVNIENPTSVEGSETTTIPFAKKPVGIVYKNKEGADTTMVFIGLCQGKNVFIPANTYRPYIVKDSDKDSGYGIAFGSKASPNDETLNKWLSTALLLTYDDLKKGIGGAITMDDGKVWRIYAHKKVADNDPRITKTPALAIVGKTDVVLASDTAFSDPTWEGIEEGGKTAAVTGSDVSTENTSTGLSTTAKIGIGAGTVLGLYLIFGRKGN